MEMEGVQVAVRLRPWNKRIESERKALEKNPNLEPCVSMNGQSCTCMDPSGKDRPFEANFDYCFNSFDTQDPETVTQEVMFNILGKDLIEAAWEGYEITLFAYGQSGSGKTFSMTGPSRKEFAPGQFGSNGELEGLVPRISEALMIRCADLEGEGKIDFKMSISVTFIYDEKVTDLLETNPRSMGQDLRIGDVFEPSNECYQQLVRGAAERGEEKPPKPRRLGWGCPQARREAVLSIDQINHTFELAESRKVVSSTGLNKNSSRGHTVMTVYVQRINKDSGTMTLMRLNLVDLAGSERLGKSGAKGKTADEGRNINLSLTALGSVIRALGSSTKTTPSFRAYKLTHVLQGALTGDSKTVMIAALNPFPDNFEETRSTLRFAKDLKQVKLRPKKNEVSDADVRKALEAARKEIEKLQEQLAQGSNQLSPELQKRLAELEGMQMDRHSKEHVAANAEDARLAYLKESGLRRACDLPNEIPRLRSLTDDVFLSEVIMVYALDRNGSTIIGKLNEDAEFQSHAQILLQGPQVAMTHMKISFRSGSEAVCDILYDNSTEKFDTFVNGVEIETPTRLRNGDRIWVGNAYCFVFEDPLESPPQGGFMTYQLAYKERLKSDGYRDPDEVEAELRAQAEEMQRRLDNAIEKQKADAERKLAAQEAKMQSDFDARMRELASQEREEERQRLEVEMRKKQEEFESANRQLAERLEAQRIAAIEQQQRHLKNELHMTVMENKLAQINPMVRKANAMAQALDRPVSFEARIRENGVPVDPEDFTMRDVMVEASCAWRKSRSYISFDEFKDARFPRMLEVYEQLKLAILHGEKLVIPLEEDPFYLRMSPDIIGESLVPLLPIGLGLSMSPEDPDEVSAINCVHNPTSVLGDLEYRYFFTRDNDNEEAQNDSNLFDPFGGLKSGFNANFSIVVQDIIDLHSPGTVDVFISYRFYDEQIPRQSMIFSGEVTTVPVNWCENFSVFVTPDFSDYLRNASLVVKIWGTPPDPSPPALLSAFSGSPTDIHESFLSHYSAQSGNEGSSGDNVFSSAANTITSLRQERDALKREVHRLEADLSTARTASSSSRRQEACTIV